MSDLCYKSLDVEVKAADDQAGTITLYAAAFGNVDRQGEVIVPGAFMNLSEFVSDGWIGLAHDMAALPVATVKAAEQDSHGLRLECEWHSTPEAQKARTVVKERLDRGKAVKCSIGYRVVEAGHETRDGNPVAVLKQIELFEASIVNLPANPRAEVVEAKAWWQVFEDARAAVKDGRVLSDKNRRRLGAMAGKLREAADDLDGLLKETEPAASDDSDGIEKSVGRDPREGRLLVGDFLSHCATYPAHTLGDR